MKKKEKSQSGWISIKCLNAHIRAQTLRRKTGQGLKIPLGLELQGLYILPYDFMNETRLTFFLGVLQLPNLEIHNF